MARWRLARPHYLNVRVDPPVQWEYIETSQDTGRRARKMFDVPQLLDPDDPRDHNYPGEIIVCHEGKGNRKDIVFLGAPTGDMEPLDEEAEQISEAERKKWVHPIDALPGEFSASLLSYFEQQLMQASSKAAVPANQSIKVEEFKSLQEQVAFLMHENEELKRASAAKSKPAAH